MGIDPALAQPIQLMHHVGQRDVGLAEKPSPNAEWKVAADRVGLPEPPARSCSAPEPERQATRAVLEPSTLTRSDRASACQAASGSYAITRNETLQSPYRGI